MLSIGDHRDAKTGNGKNWSRENNRFVSVRLHRKGTQDHNDLQGQHAAQPNNSSERTTRLTRNRRDRRRGVWICVKRHSHGELALLGSRKYTISET